MSSFRIGTCSWKFDSWQGIVYSNDPSINYLKEYSEHFNTVEVDQWFWSLFEKNKVLLPQKKDVLDSKNSIPEDFRFTIKVPNSITLTHHYNRDKSKSLIRNSYFLSVDLFGEFLETIKPLKDNIGCLIFQFEYLNREKMSSVREFKLRFGEFNSEIDKSIPLAIEIRNPNYLNEPYFKFLNELNIAHVFLEGYYMPPVSETYKKFKDYIKDFTVIRLHGPDRKGMEKISGGEWNKIYSDRMNDLKIITELIGDLRKKDVDIYLNVNNHYEGSAPLTVKRIIKLLNEL